jgi:hypothetical protein
MANASEGIGDEKCDFLYLQMNDKEIAAKYAVRRTDAMYYLWRDVWGECEERWDRFAAFFSGDPSVHEWCQCCPEIAKDTKDDRRWGRSGGT